MLDEKTTIKPKDPPQKIKDPEGCLF